VASSPDPIEVPLRESGDEEVPKLPRGRGFKLSTPQLIRIGGTALLLVLLIVMQKPCAEAVSGFVTGFDGSGSAAKAMPKPGNVDVPHEGNGSAGDYEHLGANMTDAELKAAVERSKAKHRADEEAAAKLAGSAMGSGSATAPGSGSAAGSATPPR
jgi:hypothetical protein